MSITFPYRDYESALAPWTAVLTATATHETSAPLLGVGSAKIVTPGTATFEGITSGTSTVDDMVVDVAPSTAYTLSVYVKAPAGCTLRPRVTERTAANASAGNVTFANIVPATTETTRYSWTWTTGATAEFLRDFRMLTVVTAQAITFYVDGWQLDTGATALTYDGADAPSTGVNLTVGRGRGVKQPAVPGVRSAS